jgi:hypothetical protein
VNVGIECLPGVFFEVSRDIDEKPDSKTNTRKKLFLSDKLYYFRNSDNFAGQ